MRIFLALIALTASAPVSAAEPQAKPSRFAMLCKNSGERSAGGLNKTCYYQCAGVESGGITGKLYETCPRWVGRWRLNHNSQFGPSAVAR